jgi:acyl-coenzyme A synthetase/AMP-(fatty) acid ligase
MDYKRLIFNGDIREWINQILTQRQNLLLCTPDKKNGNAANLPKKHHEKRYLGLYTSASTGDAKCIWNSFENLVQNARLTAHEFEISQRDRLLMMAKPWHVAGLSWALMAEELGSRYKFVPTQRGEDLQWFKAIQEFTPDYLLTVPAVLRSLFDYENWHVPRIVFGGSPIKIEDYSPLFRHTETIYQGYGQTEAGGLISCHRIDQSDERTSQSCYCYGRLPSEFQISCEGSPDNPQPIFLKSPTAIYDDFYDTGDVGFLDENKRLFLTGRNQDS